MPSASISMLLYSVSVLDRLLPANAMGLSTELSGAVSIGQLIPSLTCNSDTPRPPPDASISWYSDSFSS